MGGGGRGMRVIYQRADFKAQFARASNEALAAFGDGRMFVEKFVQNPRHIEIQILADGYGNVVHLHECDCSVQRRHQKVVEMAPSFGLPPATQAALYADAVRLCQHVGYKCAGTVEFMVAEDGSYYFLEVNPRVQVEHTVTEEVTGIDIVQSQIRIAGGASLADLGIASQADVGVSGFAIQARVTSEDPANNFQPDSGRLVSYRAPGGLGIRLDGSITSGGYISPHYDSLMVKVTAKSANFETSRKRLERALQEFRIRGIKTNIPFIMNVLRHPSFKSSTVTTDFVGDTPELFDFDSPNSDPVSKYLRYVAEMVVNGPQHAGAVGPPPSVVDPTIPDPAPLIESLGPGEVHAETGQLRGWRDVLQAEGPEGYARALRAHSGLLLTDTTWRDAHQSVLATRLRTIDMLKVAPYTGAAMRGLASLEMWGGATFDVSYRFLYESPWERLSKLREAVPHVPFQMLLRGANGVGYSAYPDNVVKDFVRQAKAEGVDVFRVFDSLNYVDNLKFGMEAVRSAGGVVEGTVCYTGDLSNPGETKYTVDYYLRLARALVDEGVHILGIKDMAGLLKPNSCRTLISALRREFPDVPIHVHTHDTAGMGVSSMLACAEAGADVVDGCIDSMSGMTSQPSIGALINAVKGTPLETGIDPKGLGPLAANRLMGNIVKVTPSSKVVGDLAQFIVANNLTEESLLEEADTLSFPSSVVDFMQGYLGVPEGGFPEPLRTKVLKGATPIEGRPGESLPPVDLGDLKIKLQEEYGKYSLDERDVISAAMYPDVFKTYRTVKAQYGDLGCMPTRLFLTPMKVDEEVSIEAERGVSVLIKYKAVGELLSTGEREVFFEVNGSPRVVDVLDKTQEETTAKEKNEKADPDAIGSVGAPMSGSVVEVQVKAE